MRGRRAVTTSGTRVAPARRLIVDGLRPSRLAIARIDSPPARASPISSRSANVKHRPIRLRLDAGGPRPPLLATELPACDRYPRERNLAGPQLRAGQRADRRGRLALGLGFATTGALLNHGAHLESPSNWAGVAITARTEGRLNGHTVGIALNFQVVCAGTECRRPLCWPWCSAMGLGERCRAEASVRLRSGAGPFGGAVRCWSVSGWRVRRGCDFGE